MDIYDFIRECSSITVYGWHQMLDLGHKSRTIFLRPGTVCRVTPGQIEDDPYHYTTWLATPTQCLLDMTQDDELSDQLLRNLVSLSSCVISRRENLALRDPRLHRSSESNDSGFHFYRQHKWGKIARIEIYTRFDRYFYEVYETMLPFLNSLPIPHFFRGTYYRDTQLSFEDHVCYIMISAPEAPAPSPNPKALVINWYFEQMSSPYANWDEKNGWFSVPNLVLCPWSSMISKVLEYDGVQDIAQLKYGYDSSLVKIDPPYPEKDIDVLFAGHPNDRRLKLKAELEALGVNIVFVSDVFGLELDKLIVRAKINLNLHYYYGAFLEIHRINRLLAYGSCVVSERSDDEKMDQAYEEYIHFVDIEQMAVFVKDLLQNPQPKADFTQSKSMTSELQEVLLPLLGI